MMGSDEGEKIEKTTVAIPKSTHKRLSDRKVHDRQPLYEVIQDLLDEIEAEEKDEVRG